ncbi:MAG TPA: class I SAM-dependent methyltransferase [Thermodesulfobacteriota bacterium]|nr:class I SAM-dependent methyltransferase [Thermodesulfobacteriota bacterium]
MIRITEPELMEESEQALAYGRADFEEPHSNFMRLLRARCPFAANARAVLDLGCGTGDITFRLAEAFSGSVIDALDGSEAMLSYARDELEKRPEFKERIRFIRRMIQEYEVSKYYDLISSNSLLHHIRDPAQFWQAVKRLSGPGTSVFIMDLLRPVSPDEARRLVETHSPNEPDILKRDFYNSLLAAFEIGEVTAQLDTAGLGYFTVEQSSDRHLIVYGVRE